jgi:hypothetical protein
MGLGTFFADVLADLEFTQAVDDHRPNDEPREQRRKASECSAEREIAKNPEGREIVEKLDEQQPVKQ